MINKLSEFIKMKRGDMSLREFAKLCGNISHTQIDSIERGIDPRTSKPVRPTVETLSKIAKGTGVSVAYLAALANGDDFTDNDEPKKKIPKDLKKLLDEEEITLNGRMVSPEDKEKMLRIIEALYYDAKKENKRKS